MPAIHRRRKASGLTGLDQFCGAGGTTTGAKKAGVEIRVAINHNPVAIQTHAANHPEVAHDCADLSKCHPSRYVRTDFLFASPECTHHSAAAGARRKKQRQLEMDFAHTGAAIHEDDLGDRSRATMWEVPKFLEHHGYEAAIVENVWDVLRWPSFDAWRAAIHSLGYHTRLVSLNARVCQPTPQSRDRLYVVAWRQGNPAPNLDIRPDAPCPHCGRVVQAVQRFKWSQKYRRVNVAGEFGAQYHYACPDCHHAVEPFQHGVINAIDPTIDAPTLAEKAALGDPVAQSIRIRLEKALEAAGEFAPLLVTTNCTTHNGRTRTLFEPAFTLTCSNTQAVALPPTRRTSAAARWSDAVRPASALVDPTREAWARELYAGSRRMTSIDDYCYRSLTVRERLEIMGFPADYRLCGTIPEQHKQIGNANPPESCYTLAARVAASLYPEMYPEAYRPRRERAA